jgi:hypothetical protein
LKLDLGNFFLDLGQVPFDITFNFFIPFLACKFDEYLAVFKVCSEGMKKINGALDYLPFLEYSLCLFTIAPEFRL